MAKWKGQERVLLGRVHLAEEREGETEACLAGQVKDIAIGIQVNR